MNVPEAWSFGTTVDSSGGTIILRAGTPAADGYGILLVKKDNQIYANTNTTGWYLWVVDHWDHSADPR